MTFASADILGRQLRPLCSRDNHAMKYESTGSPPNNAGNPAAYHCRYMSCCVRYNLAHGYYMLIGMPDHANPDLTAIERRLSEVERKLDLLLNHGDGDRRRR